MTDAPVRRRGRPPVNAAPAVTTPAMEPASPALKEAVAPSKRRARTSVGGFGTKLSAPTREGYNRRFVNDTGNRIAEMQQLGYTIVEQDGVQSFDPGSVITRLAGTKDGGAPLKTILMETPAELYQQGRDEMEQENAITDQAIKDGHDREGGLTEREMYRPAGHRNSIEIER
jgi:hypothetical protein